MSRRESLTSQTVTTRSKSHIKKKPGRKPKPKMKTKSPQAPRKSRSPKGPDRARKVYRSAKTLDPNSETITISPTPPASPVNSPPSTPGRTPSPCDEDELFEMIKIEVDPVKPKPVKKSKPQIKCKTDFYPDIQKRCAPEKQSMLQYKYNLRLITRISKRKVAFPKKEPSEGDTEDSVAAELFKIEAKEETGREKKVETQEDDEWVFNDEDLTEEDYNEIFYCESPVWWEKAPNSDYDEDPIDRRLIEEAMKVDSPLPLEEDMEMRSNEIHRSDQTFFKKKSKLESVLDNIKVKKAAVQEDNEKREARCSESSDGDIFADISLNDLEMMKSLQKIVIPVENTAALANDVQDAGENVCGSNNKVAERRTSENIRVEDMEIDDAQGKYAGKDTGEEAVEMCIENKSIGDISAEKADAYTEKEIEAITSNKENRDEEIDTGDLQMYVEINKEDKLDFNNTTDADEIQRNNQTTIFTDLVAADFDREVRDLGKFQASSTNIAKSSTEAESGSICEQNNSDNVSENEINAMKIGAECSKLEKLQSDEITEYNSKYTQVESESIYTQQKKLEESHANQMDAMEIGAVTSNLENMQFCEIIVEECDLKNAFETYCETEITKQNEQEDIIMVVELDPENLGLEKLHASETDTKSICIPCNSLEEINVKIIDIWGEFAKGGLDQIFVSKIGAEEINNQYAHEMEAEIISTQQYTLQETGANEIIALEVSVEGNVLEDDHSDVVEEYNTKHDVKTNSGRIFTKHEQEQTATDVDEVEKDAENDGFERLHAGQINVDKLNSKNTHEIEAKIICGQTKSSETSSNEIKAGKIDIDRKDLEKSDEIIIEEFNSINTDSEREGITRDATDEVEKDAERSRLERLHAGKMVMEKFIYEDRQGNGVINRDTEKIELKKSRLDRLNAGKFNPENLNEIEPKSCTQQYTPKEKAINEIIAVEMASDTRDLEKHREITVEELDKKKFLYSNFAGICDQQNNQEELSAHDVNIENIDPEKRGIDKYVLKSALKRIKTQLYKGDDLIAKIIKLLNIYSRTIGLKRLYTGLIRIGLHYQHLYEKESRNQNHTDKNLENIDALETDGDKINSKKHEIKSKRNYRKSQKTDLKILKQSPIHSPQHSPDIDPSNMDAVEKSVADIRVENSQSDRISEELTELEITKASNVSVEQIPVEMLGECKQLTIVCEELMNRKNNNLELCYDRMNVENTKKSINSQQYRPNVGGNDIDSVVSATENFDSERICEKKESEKIILNISNPKQTDILETALKSIFSEQLDPDMCGNNTDTVLGADEKQIKNWESKELCEGLIAADINYVANIKTVENDAVHKVSDKYRIMCEELIHNEKIDSELCNSTVNVLEIDQQCICSQQYDPVINTIDKGPYEEHPRNSQSEENYISSKPLKRIGVENINTTETSALQMHEVSYQFRKLCEDLINSEKKDSELCKEKIYGIEIISKNTRPQGSSLGAMGYKKMSAPKMRRRSKYEIYDDVEDSDSEDAEFVVVATYSGNLELERLCEEEAAKFSEGNNLVKIDTMDRTHDIIKDPEKCIPQNFIQKIDTESHALNVNVEVDESYNNQEIKDLGNTQHVDGTFAAKINIRYITETKENDTIGDVSKNVENNITETIDPVVMNSVQTGLVNMHSQAEHNNENSLEIFEQVNNLIVDANKNRVKNEMYPKTTHPVETESQKCIDKSHIESLLAETRKTVIVDAKNYVQNELRESTDPVKMSPIETVTQGTLNSENLRKIRECIKTVIVTNKHSQNKLNAPLAPAYSDNTEVANANYVQNELTDTVDPITVKYTDTKEMLVMNNNKAVVDANNEMENEFTRTIDLVKSGPSINIEENPIIYNTCTDNTKTESVGSNKRCVPKEDSEKMDSVKTSSIKDGQRTYPAANKTKETTVGTEAEILYIDKCVPTDLSEKILQIDSLKIDPSTIQTQQIYTIGRNAEIRITENMEPEILYPDNSPQTELSETDLLIVTPVRIDPIKTYARKKCTGKNKKETLEGNNNVVTKITDLTTPNPIDTGNNNAQKTNKVIDTKLNSNMIVLGKVNNEYTLEAVPINPRSNILTNDPSKYTKPNSYADYLNSVIEKDHNYSKKVQILETLVLDPITNKVDQAPENLGTNLISKIKETENLNVPQTSLKEGEKFNNPKTISSVKEHLEHAQNLNDPETLSLLEEQVIVPINLNIPEISPPVSESKEIVNREISVILPPKQEINLNVSETLPSAKELKVTVNCEVPKILPSEGEVNLNAPETLSLIKEPLQDAVKLNIAETPEIIPLQSTEKSQATLISEQPSTTNFGNLYETIILDDSDVEILSDTENTNAESKIPSQSEIDQNELVVVYRIVSSDEENDEATRPELMEIDEDVPKIESKMDHKKTAKLLQIYGRKTLPKKYTHTSKIHKRKKYVLKISIDKDRLDKKLIRKIRSVQTCIKKKKKRSRKPKCSCLRSRCNICFANRRAQRRIIRPCLRAPNVVLKKLTTDESDSQSSSINNNISDLSNNCNL